MQGVVLFVIFAVALAMMVVDLAYPLLDPRVRYERAQAMKGLSSHLRLPSSSASALMLLALIAGV